MATILRPLAPPAATDRDRRDLARLLAGYDRAYAPYADAYARHLDQAALDRVSNRFLAAEARLLRLVDRLIPGWDVVEGQELAGAAVLHEGRLLVSVADATEGVRPKPDSSRIVVIRPEFVRQV